MGGNDRKEQRFCGKDESIRGEAVKTERLYAITMYLLNHGRTPASELAKQFEVSVRTIQRDIDSLCCAGIPVAALPGASGGYEIAHRFEMNGQTATQRDYSWIFTALQGLVTATNDPGASQTLEKIAALGNPEETGIVLDFSALHEGDEQLLASLQSAIFSRRAVQFSYTNNDNETRIHRVEPVALLYRWYAWYLLAWSRAGKDYRTYKLVRMRDLQVTDSACTVKHASSEKILRDMEKQDMRAYVRVTLLIKASVRVRAAEYLRGRIVEEYENGDVRMELDAVENEQFWFGALLSLGDDAEVLAPESIRQRVRETAAKILSVYEKNYDRLLS